jgi:hypothetical protein
MQWTPAARAEQSFRNKAAPRAGASEKATSDTWARPEHTSGTRAQLAFVVWLSRLCRSDCPSTRARRMRHRVEDKGNTASIAVVAGR